MDIKKNDVRAKRFFIRYLFILFYFKLAEVT